MILRRLEVRHLGCFRNAVSVGPFGEGVNILYGPNEIGKSTLMEAAALAVFDRHTTAGAEIESLQPWGTNLSPEVVMEFESGGTSYRLEKGFLGSRRSRLHQRQNGSFEPICEGDEADSRVRSILLGELRGRGRTSPDQWGIARLLWSLQRAGRGRQLLVPQVTDAVADRLRRVFGGLEVSSYAAELQKQVDRWYLEVYTPQRGDYRKESTVEKTRAELQAKQAEREQAQVRLREVRQWAEDLMERRDELARLSTERSDLRVKAEKLRQDAQALVKAKGQLEVARRDEEACEHKLDEATHRLSEYQRYHGLYRRKRDEYRRLNSAYEHKQEEVGGLESRLTEHQSQLQNLERQHETLQQRLGRLQAAEEVLRLRSEADKLAEQAKALAGLQKQLDSVLAELRDTPVPTTADITRAEEINRTCLELAAQAEARGLRVTVRASAEQRIVVKTDAGTQRSKLSAGEEVHFASSLAASLSFPGVAQIEIASGATELSELRKELRDAQARLRELLARFGVGSPADLAARLEWSKGRRDMAKGLEARIREQAKPFGSPDALHQELATVKGRLEAALKDLSLASARRLVNQHPDGGRALTSKRDNLEKQIRGLRKLIGEGTRELGEARDKLAELDRDRSVRATERDNAKERADELLGDAGDEAGLKREVRRLEQRLSDARTKTQSLEKQLPPPEADPDQLLQAVESALEDVERREGDVRNQIAVLEDKVRAAETQGHYQRLSVVEEEIAALEQRLRREVQRAVSIRLLHQLLSARRQEVSSGALAGLEERVSRVLAAVTRQHERRVQLASDLSVPGFVSDAADRQVREVETLSAGTQEQLWLAMRVALGETYAQEYGRQVMVLDDVLVYTDPDRHDRMLEVLRRAAEALQIFILTSRPALYRGLAEPRYQFDIAALRT